MSGTASETPWHPAALDRAAQGLLGAGTDRIDGPAKVTGTARYAAEVIGRGAAYGHIVGARIGCGRLLSVDASAAEAAPGVLGVIVDHPDFPTDGATTRDGSPRGPSVRIDHFGQPIALVVAESAEAARSAASLVAVDYAVEEGRFDPHAVEQVEETPASSMIPPVDMGDLDAAMAQAAHAIDRSFTTPMHFPAALEPHSAVAEWQDGRLTITAGLQILQGARSTIAKALGLDPEQVRVLAPFVGGGFGGKTGVGPEVILAAIAARDLGRPVKVALTRRQTAQLVHHRTETRQRIRIACDAEGRITGIGHESIVSQKDERTFVEPVPFGTIPLYAGAARRFTTSLVRVDLPATGAVRAPGEAIATFALETAVDEMAERLGMDPIAFRILNEPAVDPTSGRPFSTRRLVDCYREGARRFGWEQRSPKPGTRREGEWLIGHGMAAALRGNFSIAAKARVRLDPGGRAHVACDLTDIGTGTYTILAQVAGELLGLPIERVAVELGDSDLPPTAGSGGSFGAGSASSAVAIACDSITVELARRMDAQPGELTLKDGYATARNRRVPIEELIGNEAIDVMGESRPQDFSRRHLQASHGAQFAEVVVNAVTGEVRVRRMLGVFDIGRVLNAKTARSQVMGGMIWGLGYALFEDAVVDPRTGQFVNPDLAEYHVAAHADVPPIEAHFIEEPDDVANPIGAKGVGELGISGSGAAITNAIYNACGVRLRDAPMTLDRILPGLPPL